MPSLACIVASGALPYWSCGVMWRCTGISHCDQETWRLSQVRGISLKKIGVGITASIQKHTAYSGSILPSLLCSITR